MLGDRKESKVPAVCLEPGSTDVVSGIYCDNRYFVWFSCAVADALLSGIKTLGYCILRSFTDYSLLIDI